VAGVRACALVETLAVILPVMIALVSATWYLSARLTRQDGWFRRTNMRLARIEKILGMSVWDDNDD
jgi:hypothetical protein